MPGNPEQLYPFEVTNRVAIAAVYFSHIPEINDLTGFVSEVSGLDRGYAFTGVQDAIDRRQVLHTRDHEGATDLYLLNDDSKRATQIAQQAEIPLAKGETVDRRTFGLLVDYKNRIDMHNSDAARAQHNLDYLIGVIHSDIE